MCNVYFLTPDPCSQAGRGWFASHGLIPETMCTAGLIEAACICLTCFDRAGESLNGRLSISSLWTFVAGAPETAMVSKEEFSIVLQRLVAMNSPKVPCPFGDWDAPAS